DAGFIGKIPSIQNASIGPQVQAITLPVVRIEANGAFFERNRIGHPPTQEWSRPFRPQFRYVLSPKNVVSRRINGVIFTCAIIDCKAASESLMISRLSLGRCMRLTSLPL